LSRTGIDQGQIMLDLRGMDKPQRVLPEVSQDTLAEMAGTTRSRVNFFMNKFRRLGFIKYNGHLQIKASLLSVVLHE
jgi:CRP/FNR family transcriptional regulator, cyclic AMP receptor protein